jgi:hypothetical protein
MDQTKKIICKIFIIRTPTKFFHLQAPPPGYKYSFPDFETVISFPTYHHWLLFIASQDKDNGQ